MNLLRFCTATLVSSLALACGSSDTDDETTDDVVDPNNPDPNNPDLIDPDEPGTLACDPNAEIPCVEGIAEPCEGIDSGYDGDEYCRAQPDPALGLQIHVGPDDYDDPAQVDSYLIHPGEETNWAEEAQFPNQTTVYTRGYRSYMRPGSHHFIMFGNDQAATSGEVISNGAGVESAVGVGGRFLGGATRAIQNIDTRGEYPEDQGIGSEIPPNSFVAMNLHFINTTEQPLIQEIWVNFIYIDEAEVTQYVKPITWYGGLAMNVAPGEHVVLQNGAGSCTSPADLRIGMMTAHAHANTLRVTTRMNGTDVLFEDYDWHEPSEWRYNRAVTNPLPDAGTMQSGGASGLIYTSPGDSFTWECEVQNQTDGYLQFGNQVYTGEMCNVFGFYITDDRTASPWACAFF